MLSKSREIRLLRGDVEGQRETLARQTGKPEQRPQRVRLLTVPDAVVLDIQMPCGTVLDVLKNIKRDGAGPLVIVFTNFPYPQYRKRAMESGAEFFFDKTTEFEKLRELFGQLTTELEPQMH